MKTIYYLIVASFTISSCNCGNYQYARGVKEDTERVFKGKKHLIYSLSFRGVLVEKKYCSGCKINRYLITVRIDELDTEIAFQDKQYPPYYIFDDTMLTICLNEEGYEAVHEGDELQKHASTFSFNVNNKEVELLSQKELIWLP